MYERPVAHAAIDAGADVVFGHHAHIMRGIENYRGRPIFHGLGNFVTVTHALTPERRRQPPSCRNGPGGATKIYGFAPDPDMPFYPFHPESRNTAIALCRFDSDGIVEAGRHPVLDRRPGPTRSRWAPARQGDRVLAYIQQITDEARLGATLRWDGDVALIDGIGSPCTA